MRKAPPFSIPDEPVDQYEIHWYRVIHLNVPRISELRALYHVNTPWEALYPGDNRPGGAVFTDQWQVFEDGNFNGRMPSWEGWSRICDDYAWAHGYATKEEAQKAANEWTKKRIARLEEEILELKTYLVKNPEP